MAEMQKDGSKDINVLALVKGEERYVYLFDDESRAEALRVLGRHASNPDLSFTWYDAAVLSQRIRQEPTEPRIKRDPAELIKNRCFPNLDTFEQDK